ncbi:molybdenum cofactor biosynthesis protein B [Pannus brasiliensis CCIBt3594]|uniref:Molybdenum cofactor biosynthesis protein B n=1 Tax=Pannus brasiliensis CCIBt3594 TaxID=1427578 RepID=A0AAW9QP53_9CHRO
MSPIPHPDLAPIEITCAVLTVSDTRTVETDSSGREIQESLARSGHRIGLYRIIPDEPNQIQALLQEIGDRGDIDALILNGGTGIAPRDTTYDALVPLLEKTLPGFGEIFRYLSYTEIGSRAIASRAIAGSYRGVLVFSLPGSTNAVKLALEKLILPEIKHLVQQMKG